MISIILSILIGVDIEHMYRNVFEALLVVVIFMLLATRSKTKEDERMIAAMNDSITHWKDEFGREHAKVKVIESSNLDLFTKLETSNQTVKELQQLVLDTHRDKKKIEVATVVKTVTKIDTLIVKEKDSTLFKLKDKYLDFVAEMKGDSLKTKIELTSYLKLTHRYERKNIFSKKYLVVDAYEDNKYIRVEDVRSIKVPVEKSRFIIGPYVGLNYNLRPTFGIGLTYAIIRL